MFCSPHSSRMGYYCPTHVTAHQPQQHQGNFFSLSPPGLCYPWADGGKCKSGVLILGWDFWGTMCLLLCHWARLSCLSPSPLLFGWLVPLITPAAAQAPSDRALAQHPSPGLSRKVLLERTCFPSASPGSLSLGNSPFTAGCSKGQGFLSAFFPPLSPAWGKAAEPQVMQFD